MEVSHSNLEKILEKVKERGYDGTIFGSWYIPYYVNKDKGVKIDGIGRETSDLDLMISDETMTRVEENEKLRKPIGCNSYEPIEIDNNSNAIDIEFFQTGIFKDVEPKFAGRLEPYLIREDSLEPVSGGIKAPKPWVWVGLKLAAYRKSKEEKHRHDLVYLKGMLGDEKFGYFLGELKANGFEELIDVYKEMLGTK